MDYSECHGHIGQMEKDQVQTTCAQKVNLMLATTMVVHRRGRSDSVLETAIL